MRMFLGVNADELCDRHLRGVHGEIHKLLGSWKRAIRPGHPRRDQHARSILGLISRGYVDLQMVTVRHDEVTREARHRGMDWHSELSELWIVGAMMAWQGMGHPVSPPRHTPEEVSRGARRDLARRCPDCRARMIDGDVLAAPAGDLR